MVSRGHNQRWRRNTSRVLVAVAENVREVIEFMLSPRSK
jgi:hypothetical protein